MSSAGLHPISTETELGRATQIQRALAISTGFLAVCYAVQALNFLMGYSLSMRYGIAPRTVDGLVGILFSPLLHGSWSHLWANSLPLFITMAVLFSRKVYHPALTLAGIWILGGFGTWLLGRTGSVHVGASGVVFGLVAYLIAAGFYMKDWKAAIIALVVVFVYGGIFMSGIFYVLVLQVSQISWEGHLFGALAGLFMALGFHAGGGLKSDAP